MALHGSDRPHVPAPGRAAALDVSEAGGGDEGSRPPKPGETQGTSTPRIPTNR